MLQVTARTKEEAEMCPVRQVLSQVMGKWQMLIVLSLEDGALRFGALKRVMGDITQRVLMENLRKMERDGHLTCTVDPGPPVAVSYALTPLGREPLVHLKALTLWAAGRHAAVTGNWSRYDAP